MKKFISAILVILLAVMVVSCGENTAVSSDINTATNKFTAEKTEEKCKDYVYYLTIVLEYEWDESPDSKMYNQNNGLYFKSVLQSLYEYDNGKEIHRADGYVAVDDYIGVCRKYFPVDTAAAEKLIVNSGVYDAATDSVTMAEGIGSIKLAVIDDIKINGNIAEIYYAVGDTAYDPDTKTYFPDNSVKGILTAEFKDNDCMFVSNRHIPAATAEN